MADGPLDELDLVAVGVDEHGRRAGRPVRRWACARARG
jgi:hypothetical protein